MPQKSFFCRNGLHIYRTNIYQEAKWFWQLFDIFVHPIPHLLTLGLSLILKQRLQPGLRYTDGNDDICQLLRSVIMSCLAGLVFWCLVYFIKCIGLNSTVVKLSMIVSFEDDLPPFAGATSALVRTTPTLTWVLLANIPQPIRMHVTANNLQLQHFAIAENFPSVRLFQLREMS